MPFPVTDPPLKSLTPFVIHVFFRNGEEEEAAEEEEADGEEEEQADEGEEG